MRGRRGDGAGARCGDKELPVAGGQPQQRTPNLFPPPRLGGAFCAFGIRLIEGGGGVEVEDVVKGL